MLPAHPHAPPLTSWRDSACSSGNIKSIIESRTQARTVLKAHAASQLSDKKHALA